MLLDDFFGDKKPQSGSLVAFRREKKSKQIFAGITVHAE
jgi:hypothetical protein